MIQVLVETIVGGSLLALVATGLALIYRSGRVLHLAHASTYIVGGYAGVMLLNGLGGFPWLAAIGAMAAAASLGIAIEAVVYQPLRRRGSTPEVLFLGSVGIVAVVSGTIGLIVGSDLLLARIAVDENVHWVGSARINSWRAGVTVVAVLVLATFLCVQSVSRLGLWFRAVVSDQDLACSIGIRVIPVRLWAMAVGSSLAGLSAFFLGVDTALSPQSGLRILLLAFTAMIVGGSDRPSGPILGGFLVALIQQTTSRCWDPAWQDGAVFAMLVALLLIRPAGVVGARR